MKRRKHEEQSLDLAAGIATAVRRRKEEFGLSWAEIARRCGTSIPSVKRCGRIRPEYVPSIGRLLGLAEAFGCPVSELIAEAEFYVQKWGEENDGA